MELKPTSTTTPAAPEFAADLAVNIVSQSDLEALRAYVSNRRKAMSMNDAITPQAAAADAGADGYADEMQVPAYGLCTAYLASVDREGFTVPTDDCA